MHSSGDIKQRWDDLSPPQTKWELFRSFEVVPTWSPTQAYKPRQCFFLQLLLSAHPWSQLQGVSSDGIAFLTSLL